MKLRLVCVGKPSAFLREGIKEYAGRIGRYLPLETIELKEEKGGRKPDPSFIREKEGERILERIPPQAHAVVLDEKGRSFSSEALSEYIGRQMLDGTPELVLVVGGAYGLSAAVRRRANLLLSLSAMTFTHQMARMLVLEQVYRAMTILRNEPYHNR